MHRSRDIAFSMFWSGCQCMQPGVGYKMKLIMPADQSEERRAAMAAFGAELISVPASSDGGGMEAARDLATKMQVMLS